ncbi:MAG: type I glyceraldehyde-3-phosphate dehydrogenase [Candidatus Glassbacteria bacterium]
MATKIGINGFGRIGRSVLRCIHEYDIDGIDVVAVNDITDAGTLGHLLKYDSVSRIFPADVKVKDDSIVVDGKSIRVLSVEDPAALPWKDLGVDVVIESTGLFRSRDKAEKHIKAGAKKVIITAPAKGEDITLVIGVNDAAYKPDKHHILSNASCTTNCLAPVAKVIHEKYGIARGLMTTIHAYTNDQRILDLPHKDLRRARAAGLSMIPTTTGAAKALSLVIPQLEGKLDGLAVRVPTPNVSLVDLVVELERDADTDSMNEEFERASTNELRGILEASRLPLVSVDFTGNPHSAIVDLPSTNVIGGRMLKVLAWYDNEWAYSLRTVELAKRIGGTQ